LEKQTGNDKENDATAGIDSMQAYPKDYDIASQLNINS
jgi:hypothetical protein